MFWLFLLIWVTLGCLGVVIICLAGHIKTVKRKTLIDLFLVSTVFGALLFLLSLTFYVANHPWWNQTISLFDKNKIDYKY